MRRFLLLFVLLCFGTYLSAQTLSARFAVDSAEMCYPQRTVHFTDQSTGQIVSWNWFFGDGTSSTEQNPTHIYSGRGKYVVSLVVTDINGHIDSTTAAGSSVAINIYPFIDFGIPHNYVACSELKLSNQAYSHMTGSFPVQLLWSTGSSANTISADSTGKYILYQQQCGTYISDSVYVIKPAHVLTIGDPLLVSYNLNTDSVLIDWGALYPFPKGTKYDIDWGAGVTADTLKQTNYIWYKGIMGKTLSVSFKATLPAGWGTQCGTIVTATRKVENARMSFDDWNGQNITMNYGDTLRTGNPGYFYNWTLPDGTIKTDTTGYLVVTQSGKYTLSLSYLYQSIMETVNVNVIGQLSPVFKYSHVNCDPLTISCTYTGNADSIVAYKWSVNGRYASMDRNPVLKIDSGLNVIGIIITNASGDSAVMSKTISSEGAWKLKIAIDSIYPCSFRAYLRTTTNAPEGKYSVSWEKGTSYAYDMNMAIADSSGIYIANLKDSCGNIRATDTLNLFLDRVIRPIIAKVGDSIKVSNIMADITYKWYRNDTLVGTGTVAPYPAKSGIYSAYAYRNDSCFRQSWPLTYIAPGEGFSYGISRLPSACGLNAIDFTVTPSLPYGDSVVSYLWVAGKDTSRTNRLTVVKKEWGTVNPVLTMISNYGLTKTITDSYTFPDLTFKVTRLAYNTCHDTARLLANVSTINAYQVVWDGKYVGNPYRPTTSGMHYAVLQDTCGNSYLQDSALVTLFPYTAALALNATKDTIHSTPDDSTAYTYQWYRDGVLLQNESRSYLTSLVKGASYVAALSDTAGCMKSSAALVYNGGTKLRASFTAVPSKCDSSVFQFYGSYDNLTPGDSVVSFYYQFDPSGGGTTQNSFNVFLRGKGIYPVTYSIRTLKGDTASQTQYLLVPDVDRTPWPVEIKVERDSSFPCNDYKILTASTTESKAYYFKWSTDEFRNSIEVQKSGTYNVVVYDSCSVIRGVAQIDINVLEPFNPSITYISGNPDTLMAAVPPANITYEWTRDNTVLKDTGNYILPVGSGTYRVRAFNEKGCITGNAS
ncbi:PKD domain-containing protein, partial [Chitinophaga sancti]|uniref:PKD domain-containing protein n=1 Tax=Chitinophaga sancti TaxID=1004 RepID=UPI003F78C4BD